jgi:phosphohistidine phosphatase
MRLYFLRHAVAYDREEWPGTEADRPLTEPGRQEMRLVALGLASLDLGISLAVTSPFARALETARIADEALHTPLAEANELAPGATLGGLLRVLQAHEDASRLLLVGHEPDFSQMIGALVAAPHPANLALKKAGCACVDVPRKAVKRAVAANDLFGQGTLRWLLPPRQLVRIGGSQPLYADTAETEAKHT